MSEHFNAPSARWGPERRLEFIDFRLRWEGRINRSELVAFFGISIQQASADLANYARLAPNNIHYDKQAKTFRAASNFASVFEGNDAELYLSQLSDLTAGVAPQSACFIGWQPPCDIVRYPSRPVSDLNLLRLLWAMRDEEEIEVTYQSMRQPDPSVRWIAPHALASDGLRWHVRAWCHANADFRDFVLSRVMQVSGSRPRSVDPRDDIAWQSHVDVVVKARTGLSSGQRAAIETDFGMTNGRLAIHCRRALAFYVVRQLHLERLEPIPLTEQPLELENRDELSDVLAKARKLPDVQISN
ncbi:WYL domain-containing protein [Trinickia mobilis]|uniref:WYL domain-containing protein n=1 Tax=Trinickia mobilis TaxID=2816356 RepID=UPI001A8E2728|nr:WYL domain-containing protein [Trinickia mobilis]